MASTQWRGARYWFRQPSHGMLGDTPGLLLRCRTGRSFELWLLDLHITVGCDWAAKRSLKANGYGADAPFLLTGVVLQPPRGAPWANWVQRSLNMSVLHCLKSRQAWLVCGCLMQESDFYPVQRLGLPGRERTKFMANSWIAGSREWIGDPK